MVGSLGWLLAVVAAKVTIQYKGIFHIKRCIVGFPNVVDVEGFAFCSVLLLGLSLLVARSLISFYIIHPSLLQPIL